MGCPFFPTLRQALESWASWAVAWEGAQLGVSNFAAATCTQIWAQNYWSFPLPKPASENRFKIQLILIAAIEKTIDKFNEPNWLVPPINKVCLGGLLLVPGFELFLHKGVGFLLVRESLIQLILEHFNFEF